MNEFLHINYKAHREGKTHPQRSKRWYCRQAGK